MTSPQTDHFGSGVYENIEKSANGVENGSQAVHPHGGGLLHDDVGKHETPEVDVGDKERCDVETCLDDDFSFVEFHQVLAAVAYVCDWLSLGLPTS